MRRCQLMNVFGQTAVLLTPPEPDGLHEDVPHVVPKRSRAPRMARGRLFTLRRTAHRRDKPC